MANISVLPNTEIQSTKKRHQHKRVKVSKSVHLGRVLAVVKQLSPKELQLLEPWFRSRQESLEIKHPDGARAAQVERVLRKMGLCLLQKETVAASCSRVLSKLLLACIAADKRNLEERGTLCLNGLQAVRFALANWKGRPISVLTVARGAPTQPS